MKSRIVGIEELVVGKSSSYDSDGERKRESGDAGMRLRLCTVFSQKKSHVFDKLVLQVEDRSRVFALERRRRR